jgi:hypothetical protein
VNPLGINHTLTRAAPRGRCRSLGHRGGDATQRMIRSHSRTLESSQRDGWIPRGITDGRVIVRLITRASTCFRTKRGAPVKSDSPRSPFIAAGGAPNVNRWPGMEACEQRSVRLSLAGHVSPRRLWSERVEDARSA